MGRSAPRDSRENEDWKMFKQAGLDAGLTFLVGLVLLVLGKACDYLQTPPPVPLAPPTVTEPPAGPPEMPTSTALPTATVPTPTAEDGHCLQRLDPIRGTPFIYRVRRGDTPSRLSDCFDVLQDELMNINWIKDPTKMYEDTYIVIPPKASTGAPPTAQTMLTDQERGAIGAFNAIIADMFVQWPHEPGVSPMDQYADGQALQSALLWVHTVLQPYNPATVLNSTPDWNLPPTLANPDFGWEPWERGAYATIRWRIQMQRTDGTNIELTLYQSVHYGLGTLQTSPQVTRFETLICRYPGMTAITSPED